MSGTVLVGRGGTDRGVISAPSKASEGKSRSLGLERTSTFPDCLVPLPGRGHYKYMAQ